MAEIYVVKTFDQIYTAQKNFLIGKNSTLTNFNDGGRNNTIIEATSLVVSETQEDFFQALKAAIPAAVYNGWGFTKKAGSKSSGKLLFSRSTVAAEQYLIPIGTTIILNGIKYSTIEAGSIGIGSQNSSQILSSSEIADTSANISVNAIDTLSGFGSFINQPPGVESATNPVAFTGGTSEETENERASRFRDFVTSLAKSPVSGILSGVLSIEGVKSATVLENTPQDGWVTIYADDGTGNLSSEKQTEIENVIKGVEDDFENFPGYKAAGIYIQVLVPTIFLINVTAALTVIDSSSLTNTEAENLAITAIQNYTNSLKLGDDWIKSEAVTAVQNSDPGIYDIVISVPAGDRVVINDSQLAKTNTINITVDRT
jgi:hypothetical protein